MTDREALRERVALAIQLADECEIPDDYSHGLDPNVSDWGAFLADAVIDLIMGEAAKVVEGDTALRAENKRLRGELADFRRFVKEQFGYEDALEKETSA